MFAVNHFANRICSPKKDAGHYKWGEIEWFLDVSVMPSKLINPCLYKEMEEELTRAKQAQVTRNVFVF